MQKSIRVLKIWKLCREKRRSAGELAEMCDVTERTIFRDIGSLEKMGVLLAYDRGYYIVRENPLPQQALTSIEQLVLTLALQNLPLHLDKELEDVVNGVLNKLLDRPKENPGIALEAGPRTAVKGHVFTRLQKAVDTHQFITLVEYHHLEEPVTRNYRVEPYHLTFRDRNWYLIAWSPGHQEFRIYRMSRIVKLRVEKERFEPRDFDPEEYFRGSLGIIVDKPQRMRARFTGLAKEIVKKDGRFSAKEMQEDATGLILDTVINGEIQWLRWILGFGGEAEILEPAGMREKAIRMLREGLQVYDRLGMNPEAEK